MKRFILKLVFIIIYMVNANGQENVIETLVLKGDTVSIELTGEAETIQWQYSSDKTSWDDFTNETDLILVFVANEDVYIRGKLQNPNCNLFYSDTTLVNVVSSDSLATQGICPGEIFYIVEEMPQFLTPNGYASNIFFQTFIKNNMAYPQEAIDNNIEGVVYAQFIVSCTGLVVNAEIVKSVHPLLDNETLRLINLSPLWIPGKQHGEPVNVSFTIPLTFSLE